MALRFSDDDLRAIQGAASIRAQQAAQDDYNRRMAEAQARVQQAQARPTNPLESVLSGIGNSIANVGTSLYDMFGTGIASMRDLATGNGETGKYRNEWMQHMKKDIYGDENLSDRDYRAKAGGKALDAAATVSDFIPGLGKAAKVGLNVGQGVVSGAAQNYIDNGDSAKLEDTLKGALVGGASAGVGQYVGGKLAPKMAGKGVISKAINSNIGKAAITGAASGATGGALGTALNGGDLMQTLGGGLQGAGSGAAGGAIMAGAMGAAGKGIDALNRKVTGTGADIDTANTTKAKVAQAPDLADDTETATGWGDKNMTGSAKKRNALQKFGDKLQDTGQKTQDQAVIGKLKGNLADEVTAKNSVQRLREIGFEPSDYEQAANLSEVANKWYDDQVKDSKVQLDMPDTYKIVDEVAYIRNLTPDQADKLKGDIYKRLDSARVKGGGMSTFDAAGLEGVAKGLGQDAERMTTTNYGGSKKRINNLSADAEAYANALNDVKGALRSKVDDMVDYNPDTLRKVLKDAGATQQQIDYLTDANSMAAVKRNTSLLEDARNMQRQIKSSPLKRGANADSSTSILTQGANAAGASGLLNMAVEPVGKGVGKIEKKVGKAISAIGDAAAGAGTNKIGKVAGKIASGASDLASALNNDTLYSASYAGYLPSFGEVATSQLARQAGIGAAKAQENERNLEDALQNVQNVQNDYDNAMMQIQQAYPAASAQSQAITPGQQQLDRISTAMELALNAGDLDAYSQLASLYQQAYKIYAPAVTETATTEATKLTDNQSKALSGLQQLEQLASMKPTTGTALKSTPLGGFVDMAGGDPYSNQAQSLALTLGYLQSGANVSKTEAENIGKSYIPTAFDSEQVRQEKLSRARALLNNYLYGTQYYQQ